MAYIHATLDRRERDRIVHGFNRRPTDDDGAEIQAALPRYGLLRRLNQRATDVYVNRLHTRGGQIGELRARTIDRKADILQRLEGVSLGMETES